MPMPCDLCACACSVCVRARGRLSVPPVQISDDSRCACTYVSRGVLMSAMYVCSCVRCTACTAYVRVRVQL